MAYLKPYEPIINSIFIVMAEATQENSVEKLYSFKLTDPFSRETTVRIVLLSFEKRSTPKGKNLLALGVNSFLLV